MIWLLLSIALLITQAWIAWFFYRPLKTQAISNEQTNIALAKLKLAELSQDLADNLLSQAQFDQAKSDISQTLAQELAQPSDQPHHLLKQSSTKAMPLVLGLVSLFVIVTSLGLYQLLGTTNTPKHPTDLESVQTLADLELFVDNNPKDIKAVQMLAYSYFSSNQLEASARFYHLAYQLNPRNVEILIEYASVLAALQNNNLIGRPAKLIQEALLIDKNHMTALYLAGLTAYQQGQFRLTQQAWQQAVKQAVKGGKDYQVITEQLQTLEAQIQSASTTPTIPTQTQVKSKQAKPRQIKVSVSITDVLKANYSPDDFVLVYAKNATGRPAPLAIIKQRVKDLPFDITLTDKHAMIAGMSLSNASKILVVARVSKSGKAFKQVGDVDIISLPIELIKTPQATIHLDIK